MEPTQRQRRRPAHGQLPTPQPSRSEHPEAGLLGLQQLIGNHAVQGLIGRQAIQRDAQDAGANGAAGVASDAALDQEIARPATGACNQYLLYDAPFAPAVPTRVQTWSTFSTGNGVLDEDHFYDLGKGGDQPHIKVRAFRGIGPDLQNSTGDTFWGRVVTWNGSGQETTVERFEGWIEYRNGAWSVHSGPKPAPPAPPSDGGAPGYSDDDQVPV